MCQVLGQCAILMSKFPNHLKSEKQVSNPLRSIYIFSFMLCTSHDMPTPILKFREKKITIGNFCIYHVFGKFPA